MTTSAAQASAFFREIGSDRSVWTIEDDGGFPAPMRADGRRSMPFWSGLSRVERIIATAPAYAQFRPHELTREGFVERWLPGLERDGLLVGLNWAGANASGYDFTPTEVLNRLSG